MSPFAHLLFLLATIVIPRHITSLSIKEHMKEIKEKAKSYFMKNFDNTYNMNYLRASYYPNNNDDYKKINSNEWNEYYKCLQEEHTKLIPEAMQAFHGSSVTFKCKICLNPNEKSDLNSIAWEYASLTDNYLHEIGINDPLLLENNNMFISPEDKTLHIYNLNELNSGQYKCKLGQMLTMPYFLTVTNNTEPIDEVHTKYANKGPYSKANLLIPRSSLMIRTKWSSSLNSNNNEWSACSVCGKNKIGKKHKYGYCEIVRLHNITANKNKTKEEELLEELFEVFKEGIPCDSHIVPQWIRNILKPYFRHSEMMTAYCNETCPKHRVFEVKDKEGHILEIANNTDGIYSITYQGLPPTFLLEPSIKRKLQYENKGSAIILTCPGNLNGDSGSIKWQMSGGKNIVPEIISKESQGRIYISLTDKLHIKNARIHDSNSYSCWQDDKLLGTIQLVVERKVQLHFNHHIMLIGFVLLLSTFVYVFIRAFFNRKYAKF